MSARWAACRRGRRFWRDALSPAMRTCDTTVERQTDLSQKLARAANLLRTRVESTWSGRTAIY
ncbi:MAG: DUF3422 family protein [Pseudolabrys sp.]